MDISIYIISGILLVSLLCCFIIFMLFIGQQRHTKYLKEKNTLIKNFELELSKSQLELYENVLKEVSFSIHDNIGQILSLSSITLESIQTEELDKKTQALSLLNESIDLLRDLNKTLDPERLTKIGLGEAVKIELKKLNKTGKFKTEFQYDAYPANLSPKETLILFRIIQEAIHNIIKHAKASSLFISFKNISNYFVIDIADNGIGFTIGNDPDGRGLHSMESKASALGGSIKITSIINKGTNIQITISSK